MLYLIYLCLFFLINNFIISSTAITNTISPSVLTDRSPFILHFLVFSSNLETVITFEPKRGWLLNDEKTFRLYVTGFNLQNTSIVFSSSLGECTSDDFVSPIYPLTSSQIHDLNVELQPISKSHSSIYVCLLRSTNDSLTILSNNSTESRNATQLEGAFFTLLREKSRLPFAAKICLILMLFIVSGFFR